MDLIEFEWERCLDGYRIGYNPKRQAPNPADAFLESAGERFESYRPTKISALFQRFADIPRSIEGMRDFANSFGLLESLRRPSACTIRVATVADRMLRHHASLCSAISLFEAGELSTLSQLYNQEPIAATGWGQLRTELRLKQKAEMSIVLIPSSLIQFLWLQFALHVAASAKLLRCEKCGLPFSVGTGTGRRETAKFCSNPCRVASFRKRRATNNSLIGGAT